MERTSSRLIVPRRAMWVLLGLGVVGYGIAIVPRAATDDFQDFYRAGKSVLAGASPYRDPYFIYPPAAAYLLAPLALLPPIPASAVWYAINLAALAGVSMMCVDATAGSWRTVSASRYFIPLAAGSRIWTNNLEHGQTNLVILLLLVGSFRLAERGRMPLSGALIAIAGTFKLFPFLAALYFLRRRATVLLAAMAIVTSVLWVLPLARGVDPYASDVRTWSERSISRFAPGQRVGRGTMNQSIPAMVERLLGTWDGARDRGRTVGLLCQLAVGAALVVSLWTGASPRARPGAAAVGERRGEFAAFAATLSAMPLLSGLSWKAHYVMLLPSWFVLLAPESYRGKVSEQVSGRLRGLAFAIGAVLILTSDGVVGRSLSERFQNASIFTLSGLLIYALVVYLVTRSRPPDPREPASPGGRASAGGVPCGPAAGLGT